MSDFVSVIPETKCAIEQRQTECFLSRSLLVIAVRQVKGGSLCVEAGVSDCQMRMDTSSAAVLIRWEKGVSDAGASIVGGTRWSFDGIKRANMTWSRSGVFEIVRYGLCLAER